MNALLSTFGANGQQFSVKAGSAAINVNDLLLIGGPGNEAYTVATIDYAKNGAAITLAAATSVTASALPGGSRQQLARDAQGNIYEAGTNTGGNLVIYKTSPLLISQPSKTVDATATSVNTAKLFQLSNGTYACVYARASGALYFVIFDASLNVIAGPTSVATEYAASSVVYHDAFALAAGGFAILFQTSAGTAIDLATYSNLGAVVLAAASIQTLASTAAQEFIRAGQLPNGNIVVGYRGAMTAGGTAGTSFTICTTAGANVAGPTNIDSTAVLGFLELSILSSGYFALAEANGTTLRASVYSQAGALQGSQYSTADTLNSTTYPQVKLANDGAQFWLAYFGSAANGLNVVQMPIAGATAGQSASGLSSGTFTTSTYALDAEIINGMLVALAASSSTAGQFWLTVGLPDASLGISIPYLRTAATALGSVAATTGSYWPRIMSGGGGLFQNASGQPNNQPTNPSINGDWTAIFCFDQQNTATTFMAVQKFEASAIVGISQGAPAAGNSGMSVAVNPGPGGYTINPLAGTPSTAFNHTSLSPEGIQGTFASNIGMQLGSTILGAGASGASSSGSVVSGSGQGIATAGAAIAYLNLLEVFPDGNAYPCQVSDYAATPNKSTAILAATTTAYYAVAAQQNQLLCGTNVNTVQDSSGNVYVIAATSSTNANMNILKYTSAGVQVGSVAIGGGTVQSANIGILTNGNIFVTWGNVGTTNCQFAIYTPQLLQVVAPTVLNNSAIATVQSSVALPGGGFAALYEVTGSVMQLAIYTNAGGLAYSATITGSNYGGGIAVLSNGNIVVTTVISSFWNYSIYTPTMTLVAGPTATTWGPYSNYGTALSVLNGYFMVGTSTSNSTANQAIVVSNSGAQQGGVISMTGTTGGAGNPNTGCLLFNDGTNFWFVGINSTTYAAIYMKVSISGASTLFTGAVIGGSSAGIIGGIDIAGNIYVMTNVSTTAKYSVFSTSSGFEIIAAVTIAAGTTNTGSMEGFLILGDAAFLFTTLATNLVMSIWKAIDTAIIGVAQSAAMKGSPTTVVIGSGYYTITKLMGSATKAFTMKSGADIYGNNGSIMSQAVSLQGM